MRVAIYARVSTKDQTAENQLQQLRTWCTALNYQVIAEYVDHVSGSKGEQQRAGFARMWEDASKRKFDLLLFWSLDRLTREGPVKTINYLQRLESYGVQFKSFTEGYLDSTGIFKEAIISILATLAKQERIRLSERTKAGLDRAREEGRVGGRKAVPAHILWKLEKLMGEEKSNRQMAKELKISHKTVNKYVKLIKESTGHVVEC